MSSTLEVRTLGGLTLTYNKQPVTGLASGKAEALLVYLACTRRAYSREVLAEFLWPDRSQAQSLSNLRRELTALRQQFDTCFNITRDSVEIDPAACWLDVTEFETILAAADLPVTSSANRSRESLGRLETALALYRGDFLEGFYVESPAFEAWAHLEQERLRFRAMNTLDTLVAHALMEHDCSAGIAHATRLLQMDSLREKTHRQLMLLLAQSGQREAALAQYETCQRLLAEELGVQPTAETTSLYEQIRSGTAMPDRSEVRRIKGYELRERIGAGGFGEVYRAYQPSVNREVAIKVILPQYANDPDFIRRFEAEAQLIARLEHPFIVPLYDYWREPGGAYLVMRWLRESLRDRLQRGSLALDEAVKLVDQIASALATAHRNHVIHRDLKPANILLDDQGNGYLADFGIAKGPLVSLEATQTGQIVGSPAYLSPEQIRSEPVTPGADIYSFGVMLYEMLTGQHPFPPDLTPTALLYKHLSEPLPSLRTVRPDLPAALDEVIQRATAKDLAQRYADSLSLAAAFRRAASLGQGEATLVLTPTPEPEAGETTWIPADQVAVLRNPYKGLRAFEQADAADFFGRKALTDQLLARLAEDDAYSRFLAVVGPSGCGKSSVVKAGVIPALRTGRLSGSERWFCAEMVPGVHPLEEVELALLRIATTQVPSLLPQLREDVRGLLRAVRRVLPEHAMLLLVIDQFEEVFTLVQDATEREFFLNCLTAAVMDPRSPLRVVITLRADFTDRPLWYPDFGDLLRRRIEFVLPLTASELNQAITAPAQRVGVQIAPELLATLVKDVHDEPGILPLLQYTLTEVFERREGPLLTLEGYQSVGGVLGALAQRADEVFSRLDGPQQSIAQQLFLRLVTLGEGIEDTRRRARHSELLSVVSSASGSESGMAILQTILETFGRARLLTFDRDPLTREPTVEVAHEALIREWQRMRGWLDECRDDLRKQRLLDTAAAEWEQAGQERGFLLSGSRLAQFEGWIETTKIIFTQHERTYLNASLAERQRQETVERERQTKELETQRQLAEQRRRSANRLRYLVAGLVAFLVATTALSVVALNARNSAQRSANESLSLALASGAREMVLNNNPDLALALAVESNAVPEALPQIKDTLADIAFSPGTRQLFTGHTSPVEAVAVSPGGHYLLTGSGRTMDFAAPEQDNTMRLWDMQTGQEIRRFEGHTDAVVCVAFSPDGRTAFSGSMDGSVIHWDLATGRVIHRDWEDSNYVIPVARLAVSPDGGLLMIANNAGWIHLTEIDTGKERQRFRSHVPNDFPAAVAFAPDGRTAFSVGMFPDNSRETLTVWDVTTGQPIRRFEVTDSTTPNGNLRLGPTDIAVAISPDGKLALGMQADDLVLSSIETGSEIRRFKKLHTSWITKLVISSDGKFALSGSDDATLILWNLTTGEMIRHFQGHQGTVLTAAFTPDGLHAVSGSTDKTVRLWDLDGGNEIRRLNVGGFDQMTGLAISPDGKTALFGVNAPSESRYAIVYWDLTSSTEIRRLNGHTGIIRGIAYSHDGRTALTSSDDQTVRLWNLQTGAEVFRYNSGIISRDVGFAADDRAALVTEDSGDLILVSLETGNDIRVFPTIGGGALPVEDFVSDGHAVLVAGGASRIVSWNIGTGAKIGSFDRHHSGIYAIAVSPDGRFVLSGGADSFIILWDLVGLQEIHRFPLPTNATIQSLSFSPDGLTALSGSSDGEVILWDTTTGQRLARFYGHSNSIVRVRFSPDGQSAYSTSLDGTLRQWALPPRSAANWLTWTFANRYVRALTDEERQSYNLPADKNVTALRAIYATQAQPSATSTPAPATTTPTPTSTPSGSQAAHTGENQGTIQPGGAQRWIYNGHAGEFLTIRAVANQSAAEIDTWLTLRASDGTLLAENDDAQGAIDRNARIDALLPKDGDYEIEVRSSRNFAGGAYTLVLEPVQVGTERSHVTVTDKNAPITAIAASSDGQKAVVVFGSGPTRIFSVWAIGTDPIRELCRRTMSQDVDVAAVAINSDGRTALTGDWNAIMLLWDVEKCEVIRRFTGQRWLIDSVAFTPDGKMGLSGSYDGTARLWNLETGQIVHQFDLGYQINSIATNSNGTVAVLSSDSGFLTIVDLVTGNTMRQMIDPDVPQSVAFSPDGRLAASGNLRGDVVLWDITTGQEVRRLRGHTSKVVPVAFSADSRYLFSGSVDCTVRIWNVASGRELIRLPLKTQNVMTFLASSVLYAFSSNAPTTVFALPDGTFHVWNGPESSDTNK